MQYRFQHISHIPWQQLEACADSTVFKTRVWAEFLTETFGIQPCVIEVACGDEVVGWFYGQLTRRMGIKVLASPFEGWTTSCQGLSLTREVTREERLEIYHQLFDYCFKTGFCHMVQVSDWQLAIGADEEDSRTELCHMIGKGVTVERGKGICLDISADEETLYRSFKQKSAQYAIHKAERLGVIVREVREASDVEAFAHNFYTQLQDVFAKQGQKPTYDEARARMMLQHLLKEDKVVALEALHPETGASMATIIFVHHNGLAFYWGAASWREYQKFCPNELLFFEACKRLKAQGVTMIEMMGIREYKLKYNPTYYNNDKLVAAKYPLLITMKNAAKCTYYKLKSWGM